MSVFDLILLFVIVFSTVLSICRGFAMEVFLIFSWVVSIALTYVFYQPIVGAISLNISANKVIIVLGVLCFFISLLITSGYLIARFTKFITPFLPMLTDRILGAFFGAARGVLLIVVSVHLFNLLVPQDVVPKWMSNSMSKSTVDRMGVAIHRTLPDDLQYWIAVKTRKTIID